MDPPMGGTWLSNEAVTRQPPSSSSRTGSGPNARLYATLSERVMHPPNLHRQVLTLGVCVAELHERNQLRHVTQSRAKFCIDRTRIELQHLFGELPALPRDEKHEVSGRVAEMRIRPIDDAGDRASRR